MSISLGGVDPIKFSEGILNLLLNKGLITQLEGQTVINAATTK